MTGASINFLKICPLMTLIAMSFNLNAAEYQTAEVTAPRSVDDIDGTLFNVSNQILFYRGPVVKAIDDWRELGEKGKRGKWYGHWLRSVQYGIAVTLMAAHTESAIVNSGHRL